MLAVGAERRPPALEALDIGLKAVAVLIFAGGLWLLDTDGAAFIEFLRRHH